MGLVNFGVLSSKIVGIHAMRDALRIIFMIVSLVRVNATCVSLEHKVGKTLVNEDDLCYILLSQADR